MRALIHVGLCVLAVCFSRPAGAQDARADEKLEACSRQLEKIGKALAAYEKEQGKLPDQLSDLHPRYLPDRKVFHCPADPSEGQPARRWLHRDPKLPISYSYEFSADESRGLPTPLGPFPKPDIGDAWGSNRHVGVRQQYFFGEQVPTVRCFHHKPEHSDEQKVLNLSRDGRVYRSGGTWEDHPESVRNVLDGCTRDLQAGTAVFEKQWDPARLREYLGDKAGEAPYAALRPKFRAFADALTAVAPGMTEWRPKVAYRLAAMCYNGVGENQKALEAVGHAMRLALEAGDYGPRGEERDSVACEADALILADAYRGLGRRGEEAALFLLLHAARPQVGYFKQRLIEVHEAAGRKEVAKRYRDLADPARRLVSRPAPNFSLPAHGRGTISLADTLKGRKALLINFWFYGCGPCHAEAPHLQKLYAELKDKGLEVVAINLGDATDNVEKFVRQHGLTFPVATGGRPEDGKPSVFSDYAVSVYPTNFLIDANGKVVWQNAGFEQARIEEIRKQLARLGVAR